MRPFVNFTCGIDFAVYYRCCARELREPLDPCCNCSHGTICPTGWLSQSSCAHGQYVRNSSCKKEARKLMTAACATVDVLPEARARFSRGVEWQSALNHQSCSKAPRSLTSKTEKLCCRCPTPPSTLHNNSTWRNNRTIRSIGTVAVAVNYVVVALSRPPPATARSPSEGGRVPTPARAALPPPPPPTLAVPTPAAPRIRAAVGVVGGDARGLAATPRPCAAWLPGQPSAAAWGLDARPRRAAQPIPSTAPREVPRRVGCLLDG